MILIVQSLEQRLTWGSTQAQTPAGETEQMKHWKGKSEWKKKDKKTVLD